MDSQNDLWRITCGILMKVRLDQQHHHWPWSVAVVRGWTAAKGLTWWENASSHKSTKAFFVTIACLLTILNHEQCLFRKIQSLKIVEQILLNSLLVNSTCFGYSKESIVTKVLFYSIACSQQEQLTSYDSQFRSPLVLRLPENTIQVNFTIIAP
jgi:hypothetical protein